MESHSSSPGRRARALLRRWAQDFGLELITAIESGGAPRAGFLIDAIELLAEEVNRRWPAFGIVELDDDVRVRAMILLWGWLESASAVVEATAEYLAAHPDGPHAGASELIAFVEAIAYDYLTAADEDLAWAWMLTDLPPTVDELCRDQEDEELPEGFGWPAWPLPRCGGAAVRSASPAPTHPAWETRPGPRHNRSAHSSATPR